MLEVKTNTIQLRMDDNNLKFSFGKGDTEWNWTSEYRPKMECKEGTVYFDEALEIHHELVQNGIGKGIRSSFTGFEVEGTKVPYAFETYVWIERCTHSRSVFPSSRHTRYNALVLSNFSSCASLYVCHKFLRFITSDFTSFSFYLNCIINHVF